MANEKFKLTYYNLRGIAEPIRFLFHYIQVPFEDFRLDRETWTATKQNYPWGILPLLEESDTKKLSQSFTIGRYLGKKFNLIGKDEFESAKCDEYGDVLKDLLNECRMLFIESDENKKLEIRQHIITVHAPKYIGQFDKDLTENKYLVGSNCTWVDFFAAYYFDFLERFVSASLLDDYPHVRAYKNSILTIPQIRSWIDRRPDTMI